MANRFLVAGRDLERWLPAWLLTAVAEERVAITARYHLKKDVPPEDRVGDAETLSYLMTVGLRLPMPARFVDIYAYLTARVMKRVGREMKNLPEELRHDELTAYEQQELRQLKAEICRIRGRVVIPVPTKR